MVSLESWPTRNQRIFRDHLRAHPADAADYAQLKRAIVAARHRMSMRERRRRWCRSSPTALAHNSGCHRNPCGRSGELLQPQAEGAGWRGRTALTTSRRRWCCTAASASAAKTSAWPRPARRQHRPASRRPDCCTRGRAGVRCEWQYSREPGHAEDDVFWNHSQKLLPRPVAASSCRGKRRTN